jgi:hypothetical protein
MASLVTQPRGVAVWKFEAELLRLKEGVRTHLLPGLPLMVNGLEVDQAGIEALLGRWLATCEAVVVARKAYDDAVAARLGITVEARTFQKALKEALKQHFGCESPVLESLGIPAPWVPTPEQKQAAAAKRAHTRAARSSERINRALAFLGRPPASVPPTPCTLSEAVELVTRPRK